MDFEKFLSRRGDRSEIAERLIESKTVAAIKQRRKNKFVKVPVEWMDRLAHARHASTFKVALALLYRHWKAGSNQPVALPTIGLGGVDRWAKWRGLAELESLGLITIERRRRRSPLITVLGPPAGGVA